MKITFHLEWRVFVFRWSHGAHSTGFCPYFSKKIKFEKKSWFLPFKVAPGYLLLPINPSNLSKIEFHLSAQSAYLSRRYEPEKLINFQIFYFVFKVWEKSFPTPCRTSLYDKNSRFSLNLRFLQKITFSSKCIEMHQICLRCHFFADFARNHRNEILSYGAGKGLKISGKIHCFCFE